MTPAVSVVMSVHDGERFLAEAVESVLAQTLSDLELIVVDDGSTDSTPRLLAEFAARDARIVFLRQANRGLAAALNRGVSLARAPLVARLDADDIALPDRLERQSRFLAEHEEVAVVGGAIAFIAEDGRPFADVRYPLTDAEIRRSFSDTTPLVHPAVTIRKSAFERVGGYRPVFVESEDLDLWLRVAEEHKLANLADVVIRYRIHPSQATAKRIELQTLCALAARHAARLRSSGRPDPFDEKRQIDLETVLALGASEREITAAVVHAECWLARTMGRAAYADASRALFADAGRLARSPSGSAGLRAEVRRQLARRHAEQGHRLRARVETLRAALGTRRP